MINLDHVHFQHKTVIYFVQTFGNIYTIVPFCKHALRVFHAIARLILLAHAQTNFPPVYTGCIDNYNCIIIAKFVKILSKHMGNLKLKSKVPSAQGYSTFAFKNQFENAHKNGRL